MKKLFLSLAIFFILQSLNSQTTRDYYVVLKINSLIQTLQKTTNNDGTLRITIDNENLMNFLNSKSMFRFEQAFPTATSLYLKRVYIITLDDNSHLSDLLTRQEIEYAEIIGNEGGTLLTTDDYNSFDGNMKEALDLIRAPLAWNLTTGDPNIIVGIVDTYFEPNHVDLDSQIIQNIDTSTSTNNHGIQISGVVAAKTNNGQGIASIGYNTKLITMDGPLNTNRAWQLAQIPGVKIINGSWYDTCSPSPINAAVFEEIWNMGITPIFAAGNGMTCGSANAYVYPASYDHVISVTGIGHISPRGTNHPTYGYESWKDVHDRIGNDPTTSMNHNDKVDLCAPGYRLQTLRANNTYSNTSWGTSLSSPMVAGVAALMLAVNPNLTPTQIRDILKTTADDIYNIPENIPYVGLLGGGRVNSYRAVLTAKCMANPTTNLDLMVRNSIEDYGVEPDNSTSQILWNSPDIWVRNQLDSGEEHQNPIYNPSTPNYINVRVINRSCVTSTGNEQLKLYITIPNYGNTSESVSSIIAPNNQTLSLIGTLNIPVLNPGQETILQLEWFVPYIVYCDQTVWNTNLIAKIVSPNDPMTFPETSNVYANIKKNNNIAGKSLVVINAQPEVDGIIGGTIDIGNPFNVSKSYRLELIKDDFETGKPIFDESEVSVKMDDILFNAWQRGGKIGQNFETTFDEKKQIVSNNFVLLDNINFEPNEKGKLDVTFNFLTKELTEKKKYVYHILQRDTNTNEILGGATFEINKHPRPFFMADAGGDKEIDKNQPITISALEINENALYNWYDSEGQLIYQGKDLTVCSDITKKYKLEVISLVDGFKDYAEVEIKLKPSNIKSLVPNPSPNNIIITYKLNESEGTYLQISNCYSTPDNIYNYILNVNSSEKLIDISNYPNGIYSVSLVHNGQILDTKTLVKE